MGENVSVCRCESEVMFWGAVGDEYAMQHLVREHVAEGATEVLYRCPATGKRWVGEFLHDRDDLPAWRLRRVLRIAELVERIASAEDPYERIAFNAPDIEFRPVGGDEIIRGHAAAKAWAQRASTDPDHPRVRAVSMVEVDEERAVVFGSVAFKRDGAFNEHRPAAWLVTLKRGLLARSLWFGSWEEARQAAGLPAQDGAGGDRYRRLGRLISSFLTV